MRYATALCLTVSMVGPSAAQTIDVKPNSDQLLRRYSTTLPDVVQSGHGKTPLDIDLFVSPKGAIESVAIGTGGGLCKPICWPDGSKKICLIPIGCPGGSGGGGTLLQAPILVELTPDANVGAADWTSTAVDVTVRTVAEGSVDKPLEYKLQLQQY